MLSLGGQSFLGTTNNIFMQQMKIAAFPIIEQFIHVTKPRSDFRFIKYSDILPDILSQMEHNPI